MRGAAKERSGPAADASPAPLSARVRRGSPTSAGVPRSQVNAIAPAGASARASSPRHRSAFACEPHLLLERGGEPLSIPRRAPTCAGPAPGFPDSSPWLARSSRRATRQTRCSTSSTASASTPGSRAPWPRRVACTRRCGRPSPRRLIPRRSPESAPPPGLASGRWPPAGSARLRQQPAEAIASRLASGRQGPASRPSGASGRTAGSSSSPTRARRSRPSCTGIAWSLRCAIRLPESGWQGESGRVIRGWRRT